MDLHFSEIDNSSINTNMKNGNGANSKTGTDSHNYWEKPTTTSVIEPKKKKVSFDDILLNMNLVVSKTGVLQSMALTNNKQLDESYEPQQQYKQQQHYEPQHYEPSKIQIKKQEPLDPAVKHSFLYNKYFKDYQDAAPVEPEILVPKTREEYFKMVNEERIRRIQEKYRISQIKSKQLMFTSNTNYQGNIKATTNKLHKMSFY
jgi:hypothetical protein